MAKQWLTKDELSNSPQLCDVEHINNGIQFEPADGLSANDLNKIVHSALLSKYLVADALNWRGEWMNGAKYSQNDLVRFDGNIFRANSEEGIQSSIAPVDDGTVDSIWKLFLIKGQQGEEGPEGRKGDAGLDGSDGERGISMKVVAWKKGNNYDNGENTGIIHVVTYNGSAYYVLKAHTAELTPEEDAEEASKFSEIEDAPEGYEPYEPCYALLAAKGENGKDGKSIRPDIWFKSIAEMNSKFADHPYGTLVGIRTINTNNPENGQIYERGETEWIFIVDLSDVAIKGDKGDKGDPGIAISISNMRFEIRGENLWLLFDDEP